MQTTCALCIKRLTAVYPTEKFVCAAACSAPGYIPEAAAAIRALAPNLVYCEELPGTYIAILPRDLRDLVVECSGADQHNTRPKCCLASRRYADGALGRAGTAPNIPEFARRFIGKYCRGDYIDVNALVSDYPQIARVPMYQILLHKDDLLLIARDTLHVFGASTYQISVPYCAAGVAYAGRFAYFNRDGWMSVLLEPNAVPGPRRRDVSCRTLHCGLEVEDPSYMRLKRAIIPQTEIIDDFTGSAVILRNKAGQVCHAHGGVIMNDYGECVPEHYYYTIGLQLSPM